MVCQIGGLLLMKNKLYKYKDTIVRVLNESGQSVFIIDCLKLLHISSKLTVIQYRFLGKIFRYIIYLQKRIKNKDL